MTALNPILVSLMVATIPVDALKPPFLVTSASPPSTSPAIPFPAKSTDAIPPLDNVLPLPKSATPTAYVSLIAATLQLTNASKPLSTVTTKTLAPLILATLKLDVFTLPSILPPATTQVCVLQIPATLLLAVSTLPFPAIAPEVPASILSATLSLVAKLKTLTVALS